MKRKVLLLALMISMGCGQKKAEPILKVSQVRTNVNDVFLQNAVSRHLQVAGAEIGHPKGKAVLVRLNYYPYVGAEIPLEDRSRVIPKEVSVEILLEGEPSFQKVARMSCPDEQNGIASHRYYCLYGNKVIQIAGNAFMQQFQKPPK